MPEGLGVYHSSFGDLTRAALEEGIVPGGGVALMRAIPALEKLKKEHAPAGPPHGGMGGGDF